MLDETKIKNKFPNSQFLIENCEIGNRRDRTKIGATLSNLLEKDCLTKH